MIIPECIFPEEVSLQRAKDNVFKSNSTLV